MLKQVNIQVSTDDIATIEEAMPGLRGGPAIRTAALLWARYHSRIMDSLIILPQQEIQNEERI